MARLTVAQLMAAYDKGMGSPEGPLHHVERVVRAEVWREAAAMFEPTEGQPAVFCRLMQAEFRRRAEQEGAR